MGKILQFRTTEKMQRVRKSRAGKHSSPGPHDTALEERLTRIRASLERINKLMGEINANTNISTRSPG